jgi:NAD/NADP transhydrogenase beta subunit
MQAGVDVNLPVRPVAGRMPGLEFLHVDVGVGEGASLEEC